jgi:hypothetical protein
MSEGGEEQTAYDRVKTVKQNYESELMSKSNVLGVGIGFRQKDGLRTDAVALVVMVERKVPGTQLAPDDVIPTEIEGVPIDVQEIGKVRAQ